MREKFWFLKQCQLFEQIPEDHLSWLESQSRVKRFPKGTPVYLPVDGAQGVLLLAEGQVKLASLTAEGKQSILAFINPGEIFGELALLDGGERDEYAETTQTSTIVLMPAEAIRKIAEVTPKLALGITKLIGMRRKRIERRLKYLLFHSNRERLVHLLLELAEDYGTAKEDGAVALSIRLSHQDLASIIGSTRESVTVLLGQLQSEELLALGRRRIEIKSLDRLAKSVQTTPPRLKTTNASTPTPVSSPVGRVAF